MGFIIGCLVILALIAVIRGQKTAQRVFSVTTSIIAILSLLVIAVLYLSDHPGFLSVVGKGIMTLIGLGFVLWWGSRR